MYKKILPIIALIVFALFSFVYDSNEPINPKSNYDNYQNKANKIENSINNNFKKPAQSITKNGLYTSKNEVASYIFNFQKLPQNYITKQEAMKLGWKSKSYNLWDVAPGKSIGGDRFGNYENKLPNKNGRKWKECDIDYKGGNRNAKRLVFSNDGLIYYTNDHYNSFEKINRTQH